MDVVGVAFDSNYPITTTSNRQKNPIPDAKGGAYRGMKCPVMRRRVSFAVHPVKPQRSMKLLQIAPSCQKNDTDANLLFAGDLIRPNLAY